MKSIKMWAMNSPIFAEIVDKILQQAACPRCGAHLRNCGYDVKNFDDERLILELDCDQCESVLTLEGIFRRAPKKRTHGPNVVVSPETVRGVGAALRSFHGQDVKDLLQK